MVEQYVLRALSSSRQAEWDAFVDGHPQGHFLQSWGWGELKAGAHWHPLRLALLEQETGTMVAAAQVLRRTALRLPPRLGHLAYIPRGPVLDWTATTENGESLARLFVLKLRNYLRAQGALALHIEPGPPAHTPAGQAARACLKALDWREIQAIQPARTIVLDITPGEETLLAAMKEKWRYNVRLAARKGVEVERATDQVALGEVAPHALKQLELIGRLHAFGDCENPDAVRQGDSRSDDRGVGDPRPQA